MNKDMMKYLVIGGGVFAVYWYVTNYGPLGAVSAGHVSYWDTWFGNAPAPVQTSTGPVVVNPNPQPVVTQPGTTPAPTSTIRQQMLAASTGNPQISGGYADPSVWSYYWQQITGKTISGQQMVQMFPPVGNTGIGAPTNVDQFLAGIQAGGLSGLNGIGAIVNVPAAPSLPGMNFGGSFRRPGLRPMGRMTPTGGGPTIQ
jgi:hypothetical protein